MRSRNGWAPWKRDKGGEARLVLVWPATLQRTKMQGSFLIGDDFITVSERALDERRKDANSPYITATCLPLRRMLCSLIYTVYRCALLSMCAARFLSSVVIYDALQHRLTMDSRQPAHAQENQEFLAVKLWRNKVSCRRCGGLFSGLLKPPLTILSLA